MENKRSAAQELKKVKLILPKRSADDTKTPDVSVVTLFRTRDLEERYPQQNIPEEDQNTCTECIKISCAIL